VPYRSNHFAKTARPIPYQTAYRHIAGSVTATILLQQLEFRFDGSSGDPFYKFLERPETDNKRYRDGDSWTEELNFSKDEFRAAFDKLGNAFKSKKEYLAHENPFLHQDKDGNNLPDHLYCSYYDKVQHLTYYLRNHHRVEEALASIVRSSSAHAPRDGETRSPDIGKPDLVTLANPISIIGTKKTTEKTTDILSTSESESQTLTPKKREKASTFPIEDYQDVIGHVANIQGKEKFLDYPTQANHLKALFSMGLTPQEIKDIADLMCSEAYWQDKGIAFTNIKANIDKYHRKLTMKAQPTTPHRPDDLPPSTFDAVYDKYLEEQALYAQYGLVWDAQEGKHVIERR